MQTYCFDTSALVSLRALDTDVFSGIWGVLSEAVKSGLIHAPHEVLREITGIDDTVGNWAKKHKTMFFTPDQELVDKVSEVQKKHRFYDPESLTPKADPFLIAHAILKSCKVVTLEKPRKPGELKTRIPEVCAMFGVPVITLSDFFREQGWTFVGQKK